MAPQYLHNSCASSPPPFSLSPFPRTCQHPDSSPMTSLPQQPAPHPSQPLSPPSPVPSSLQPPRPPSAPSSSHPPFRSLPSLHPPYPTPSSAVPLPSNRPPHDISTQADTSLRTLGGHMASSATRPSRRGGGSGGRGPRGLRGGVGRGRRGCRGWRCGGRCGRMRSGRWWCRTCGLSDGFGGDGSKGGGVVEEG
ncbi:hypothetical protein EV356DRAFT_297081 [Viridothelium virens]|uniref:Uncharacterized protein n=1 Tax=Viridothelium virens TaxID=1048519 RepID=A0A6A6GZW4_VIRVR|nr:hypothetical protein EV356DRAFT_297081 [Viridothelium virens]